jgi:hypothetical protein
VRRHIDRISHHAIGRKKRDDAIYVTGAYAFSVDTHRPFYMIGGHAAKSTIAQNRL